VDDSIPRNKAICLSPYLSTPGVNVLNALVTLNHAIIVVASVVGDHLDFDLVTAMHIQLGVVPRPCGSRRE
jgi:hypothetical protein